MRRLLQWLTSLAAIMLVTLPLTAQVTGHRYMLLLHEMGNHRLLDLQKISAITFEKEGDGYVMVTGNERFNLEEFSQNQLTDGKVRMQMTGIHTDNRSKRWFLDQHDDNKLPWPVEIKNELPDWIDYISLADGSAIIDLENNDTGSARECELRLAFKDTDSETGFIIRQEGGALYKSVRLINGDYTEKGATLYKEGGSVEIDYIENATFVLNSQEQRWNDSQQALDEQDYISLTTEISQGCARFNFGAAKDRDVCVALNFSIGSLSYFLNIIVSPTEAPVKPQIVLESNKVHADCNAGTFQVGVDADLAMGKRIWIINQMPSWLTAENLGVIEVKLEANNTGEAREADIELAIEGNSQTEKLHVRQEASPFISNEIIEKGVVADGIVYFPTTGGNLNFDYIKGAECTVTGTLHTLTDCDEAETEARKVDLTCDFNDGRASFTVGPNKGYQDNIYLEFTVGSQKYSRRLVSLSDDFDLPGVPKVSLQTYELHVDKDAEVHEDGSLKDWAIFQNQSLTSGHDLEVKSTLPEWLHVRFDKDLCALLINFEVNESGEAREAEFAVGFVGFEQTRTVHVRQEAEPFLKSIRVDGGIDAHGRYYYPVAGGKLIVDYCNAVDFRIMNIRQTAMENQQPREATDAEQVSLNTMFKDGTAVFTVGQNKGVEIWIDIDCAIASYEFHMTLSSVKDDYDMPNTPKVNLETYDLHVDKDADIHPDGSLRDWYIRQDENLLFGYEMEVKSTLPEWLKVRYDVRSHALLFNFEVNESGETREADVEVGFVGYEHTRTIHVSQEAESFMTSEQQDAGIIFNQTGPGNYVQPDGDELVFRFMKGAPLKYKNARQFVTENSVERTLAGDEQIPFEFTLNQEEGYFTVKTGANRGLRTNIDIEFSIGSHDYGVRVVQMEPGQPSYAQQKAALEQLYSLTGGPQWTNHVNWMTDKPLALWNGVEVRGKYVIRLYLSGNNLVGEVPNEPLMTLIKVPVHFEIAGNGLYGELSDELQALPEWVGSGDGYGAGWSILSQSPYVSGQRRLTNYKCNIRYPNEEVEYLYAEQGKAQLYDVLKKNKLNYIGIGNPSEFLANMQLSYPGGFQVITSHFPYFETRESTCDGVDKHPFKDQTVHLWEAFYWTELSSNLGSTMILNDEGYLIDFSRMDWGVPGEFYEGIVTDVTRKYLGEPQEHEWFKFPDDTGSEDTRNDGKWKQLQAATKAGAIDIVLMGDGFGASDNEDGGRYEQLMNGAMEKILEMEPLNSLRDRINVYMVNVVSQSRIVGDGNTALNYDDDKCLAYAALIPGVNLANAVVVNITNRLDWSPSGYSNMRADGATVCHIVDGGISSVLQHEVCGHGVGRFLDEYIIAGYYDNKVSEADYPDFRTWLDGQHKAGVGLNVDYNSDPQLVGWSQMLADPRYEGLAGIYQGADKYPYDLYRSTENSLMGTDNSAMSAFQRMLVYKRIMSLTEGPDWQFDYEVFADFDAKNRPNR